MPSIFFQTLTEEQRKLVNGTYGTRENMLSSGVAYLGQTEKGDNTYFWQYGASSGYVALPVSPKEGGLHRFHGGTINVGNREFSTTGEEMTAPFRYLCHFDIRKLDAEVQNSLPFLNDGSYLPEHAAKRLGVEAGVEIEWVGHLWLKPWELDKPLMDATLALAIVHSDNRRVVVI